LSANVSYQLDTKPRPGISCRERRRHYAPEGVSTLSNVDATGTQSDIQRPGRSVNVSRILDSAQELFAKRGPAAVSVRQVAEGAGVSHALVHKYFGSKDDLIKAVLDRVDVSRAATAKSSGSLRDAYQAMLPKAMTQRDHSMMLVRSAMEGTEYVSLAERIRTTAAMVALARRTATSGAKPSPPPSDIDPRVLVSAITAMILGWASLEDWVWPTAGIDPAEKDEVYRQLIEIVGYLADLALVGDQ
jgi:TetR/AcrR family transcriptional regulator, repressor for neighboring sulfatase